MKEVLQVKNLYFSYASGGKKILKGINFSLYKGQCLGIMGLNGSGKSTLCYCLCGAIPHVVKGFMDGEVLIFGKNTKELSVPEIATKVGVVFSDLEVQLLFPEVKTELAFGPENLCLPRDKIIKRIDDVVELTGIRHLLNKNPNSLSGGEKQIVALAAVLCLDPEILILDEAISWLDVENYERIEKIIKLLKKQGKSIIIVEHSEECLRFADEIIFLENGRLVWRNSIAP